MDRLTVIGLGQVTGFEITCKCGNVTVVSTEKELKPTCQNCHKSLGDAAFGLNALRTFVQQGNGVALRIRLEEALPK